MKKQGLDPETQLKYLQHLNNLLLFCNNPIIEQMKRDGVRFPSRPKKSIKTIDEEDLSAIQKATESLEGWRGEVAKFIVWFLPYTGLRPKEIRLGHFEDLDTRTWEFRIRHPKGENSWAEKRIVLVQPPARIAVLRFLEARDKHIRQSGLKTATALIPNLHRNMDEFYSSNWYRELKKEIKDLVGFDFRLKDFRPTFAQMIVDRDPSLLPDVSTILGHSNLKTTQDYYAQIRGSTALRRTERVWEDTQPHDDNNNLIKSKKYLPGYA